MKDSLFLKTGTEFIKVSIQEILYLEAYDKYVKVITTGKNYLVLSSLKLLELQLPVAHFFRVHRSFIISLRHVQGFSKTSLRIAGIHLPLSRKFCKLLQEKWRVLPWSISGRRPTISYCGFSLYPQFLS